MALNPYKTRPCYEYNEAKSISYRLTKAWNMYITQLEAPNGMWYLTNQFDPRADKDMLSYQIINNN